MAVIEAQHLVPTSSRTTATSSRPFVGQARSGSTCRPGRRDPAAHARATVRLWRRPPSSRTASPLRMKFWADHASYPFQSHDLWFLTENIALGEVLIRKHGHQGETDRRRSIGRTSGAAPRRTSRMSPARTSQRAPRAGKETFFDGKVIRSRPNRAAYLASALDQEGVRMMRIRHRQGFHGTAGPRSRPQSGVARPARISASVPQDGIATRYSAPAVHAASLIVRAVLAIRSALKPTARPCRSPSPRFGHR